MVLVFSDVAKQVGATLYSPCPRWESFRVDQVDVLFEPNVYQGLGDENRVNVCLSSADLVKRMQEFEKQLDGNVCTCIKQRESSEYVKAKLFWDRVRFFDVNNERVNRPSRLAGYTCNIVVTIKGKWNSHAQQGLSVEVTDIQLIEPRDQECKSPFA